MKAENILDAIGAINDEAVQDAGTYKRTGHSRKVKWETAAACFCLLLTAALATFSGILKESGDSGDDTPIGIYPSLPAESGTDSPQSAESDTDSTRPAESDTDPPQSVESDTVRIQDSRAGAWFTAEELDITKQQEIIIGVFIPVFVSYRGGFYGLVDEKQMNNLRFASSENEDLLFNAHYTHTVYWVENHPDWIAIYINGIMNVYEKIFDVTFSVDGTVYAIAYSPGMNTEYRLGNMVLKNDDYAVYEAVRLRGEPAQTPEYIVNILPLLRRERPNLFDGSGQESGDNYVEQWQLALPLE